MITKQTAIAAAAILLAMPAFADTSNNVTLVLENEAGMVTQRPDLTQRECDAITALIAPPKTSLVYQPGNGGGFFSVSPVTVTADRKSALTSRLTSAKCTVAADAKN